MAVSLPPPTGAIGDATLLANVLDLDVWAGIAQGEFVGRLILSQFAQESDTLVGRPGDAINFPKWGTLGAAQELTETTEIAIDKLTATSVSATVQEIGKGYGVSDRAQITAMGDPLGEGARQMGIVLARKVDDDLGAVLKALTPTTIRTGVVAEGTPASVGTYSATTTGTALDYNLFVDAMTAYGEDIAMEDIRAIIVEATGLRKIMKLPEFKNELQGFGQIGRVFGIPVIRSDRAGTAGRIYLIVDTPLQLLYKRRPIVESQRYPSWRRTDVFTSVHYGVRRPVEGAAQIVVLNHNVG
jgi:hypothetical protein